MPCTGTGGFLYVKTLWQGRLVVTNQPHYRNWIDLRVARAIHLCQHEVAD